MAGGVTGILRGVALLTTLLLAASVAGCSASAGDPSGPDGGGKEDDPIGGGGGDDDDVGTCDKDPCDLYDQCGCESGQACDLDSSALETGGTICRGITEGGMSTSNCDSDEECAAGYGCFGNPGQCRKFCEGDGDCGLGHCIIPIVYDAGGGNYEDVPGVDVCTKPCKADAGGGSGCPDQRACDFYWHDPGNDDTYWYTDCRVEGAGGDAADCSANGNTDCLAGFGCFQITYTDETVKDECRQICIWTVGGAEGDRSCSAGTCHELGGDGIVVGDTEYGVCF